MQIHSENITVIKKFILSSYVPSTLVRFTRKSKSATTRYNEANYSFGVALPFCEITLNRQLTSAGETFRLQNGNLIQPDLILLCVYAMWQNWISHLCNCICKRLVVHSKIDFHFRCWNVMSAYQFDMKYFE